jgi:hypothetical protein
MDAEFRRTSSGEARVGPGSGDGFFYLHNPEARERMDGWISHVEEEGV